MEKPPGRITLIGIFLLLGFLATLLQTLFLRELLVVVLGNEIVFGIVLFFWLMGIFTGSRLGGRLADRIPAPTECIIGILLLLALLAPLGLIAIRHLFTLTATTPGLSIGLSRVFVATALVILPHSGLVGAAFPMAVRLVPGILPTAGTVHHMSTVYIAESLGSLVAGGLLSWLLLGHWPSFSILFAALAVVGAASVVLGMRAHRHGLIPAGALAVVLAVIGLLPPGQSLEQATVSARWHGFSSTRLVESRESRYQNIAVGRMAGQFNLYLNGQLASAFPNPERQKILSARIISQHPHPKRILLIGEAVSGLAQALLDTDIQAIHNVETDRGVVNTVERYLSNRQRLRLKDPRFQLHVTDGRRFVQKWRGPRPPFPPYDIVFIRAAEPASLLANRFYTAEFFQELTRALSPDGTVCLRITSSDTYTSGGIGAYTAVIHRTLKSVFPHVAVSPGPETFLFASRTEGVVSTNPQILADRYRDRTCRADDTLSLFRIHFPELLPEKIAHSLEQHGSRINRDDTPLALYHYSRSLGWIHAGGMRDLLSALEGFNPFWVLLILAVAMGLVTWRSRGLGPTMTAVSVAGFSGMSLQLLIITLVQSRFGFIYQYIGIFTALFMAGLPLGAILSRRFLAGGIRAGKLLTLFLCGLATISILLGITLPLAGHHPVFDQVWISLFTVLTGGLVGAVFPATLSMTLQRESEKPGWASGRVNAADHLGAALGALLAGTLMLPVLGLNGTIVILAGVNVMAAFLLPITRQHGTSGR